MAVVGGGIFRRSAGFEDDSAELRLSGYSAEGNQGYKTRGGVGGTGSGSGVGERESGRLGDLDGATRVGDRIRPFPRYSVQRKNSCL